MNNPKIYNFLCQYDQNEWDAILEDLILILAFEASGQWAAVGLNAYSDHCKIEADEYKKLARADGSLGYKTPKKKKVVVQAESDDWF